MDVPLLLVVIKPLGYRLRIGSKLLYRQPKLHLPLPERDGAVGRPRLYGPPAPTPEQILQDDSIPVVKIRCFAAGASREIPVKVYGPVYWRKAGADLPLLLVVIKPLGYRLRIGSKLLYRQSAPMSIWICSYWCSPTSSAGRSSATTAMRSRCWAWRRGRCAVPWP